MSGPASRGHYRLECRFEARFEDPLHVGTGENLSMLTDAPILRLPGSGNTGGWLNGAGVRGPIRDWCLREARLLGVTPAEVERLLGPAPGKGANDDRQGRLTVGCIDLTGESSLRDHVRISPNWGAAERGGKFDEELLHPDAATIRLTYEGDGPDDAEVRLLRSAAWALSNGIITFGGKKGWGYGRVHGDAAWHALDRSVPEQLACYLRERLGVSAATHAVPEWSEANPYEEWNARGDPAGAAVNKPLAPWSFLRTRLRIAFEGPMLIAAATPPDGHPADQTWFAGPHGRPVLPGSSLRGVLRALTFRIARSLDDETQPESTSGGTFAHAARLLWGYVGDGQAAEEGSAGDATSASALRGLASIGDGKLPEGYEPSVIAMDHVAIDRILGFACDQKLFFTEALASPVFECPISVRWHEGDDEDAVLQRLGVMLLLFALREFERGIAWVGSRTTRGYGYAASAEMYNAWCSRTFGGARGRPQQMETGGVMAMAQSAGLQDLAEAWTTRLRTGAGEALQ